MLTAFIPMTWAENSGSYANNNSNMTALYEQSEYEDHVREIKESPGAESHSSVLSAEPMHMYDDAFIPESPSNFSLALPQP